jgi:hypothetical protein
VDSTACLVVALDEEIMSKYLVLQTRLMNQRMLKSGASKVYKGSVDCALQVGCIMPNITLRNENLMA